MNLLIYKKKPMSYYAVKLKWVENVEKSDKVKKVSKVYLINALSCVEAEMRMVKETPANYQDAVVDEVKKTPISDVKVSGDSESFWLVKSLNDDDGRSEKAKPVLEVYNGNDVEEVIKKMKTSGYLHEVVAMQKFNGIVDEDLIKEEISK